MKVVTKINDLKLIVREFKQAGKSIGLVPTMGYLHDGHLSLIRASKKENDITVISIFVNPTQFGPNEDFDSYPRDYEGDFRKAEENGVDIVFAPEATEMYPEGYNTFIDVYGITDKMCGRSRPGHFRGVCTVVNKLFNIVEADRAYFGQKDAQQVAVVKRMVKDLNMGVEIVSCPIIREADGLALSSRNVYLSAEDRSAALVLSKSLKYAQDLVKDGEISVEKIRKLLIEYIEKEKRANIDYVEIVNAETFEDIDVIENSALIALAVRLGNTRLIDNTVLEV
jgi:pantoate--beta-alanine ligase